MQWISNLFNLLLQEFKNSKKDIIRVCLMNGLSQNLGSFGLEVPLNHPMMVHPWEQSCIAYCCAQLKKLCGMWANRPMDITSTPVDFDSSGSIFLEARCQLKQLKKQFKELILKSTGYMGYKQMINTTKQRQKMLKNLAELANRVPSLKDEIVYFVKSEIEQYSNGATLSIAALDRQYFDRQYFSKK